MKDITFVVRRNENDYVVYSDEFDRGYNVVPKDIDPDNAFDIEEVSTWCSNHISLVVDERKLGKKIPADVRKYRKLLSDIDSDIKYLADTDDVAFQLARHERGTEILSPEKLADCLEKDRRRGEIASTLKQRKSKATAMFDDLSAKYGPVLSYLFEA